MSITDVKPFKGAGFGAGSSSPHTTEDNMFSTDVVEVILGISEGPIKGLKDGAKTLYAGDTPFRSPTGRNNLGLYEITHRRGKETGVDIIPKLGGAAFSNNVGVNLAPSTWVTRVSQLTNIDYLDLRIVINRLAKETEKGSFEGKGKFQVQYRREGTTEWKDLKTLRNSSAPAPIESAPDDDTQVSLGYQKDRKVSGSPDDRMAYWQNAVPATTDPKAIWFDSGSNNRPKKIVNGSWVNMPGATQNNDVWTWNQKSDWGNDNVYKAFVRKKKPNNPKQGDFWLRKDTDDEGIGITNFYNGNAWVIAGGSLSPGGFGTGGDTDIQPNGVVQVTGRISSPMVKEFRIPVRNFNGRYEIRVQRVTPANDEEHFFDITWESFQEIKAGPLNFPGLATTQIVVNSSDQFSSLPDFWGVYQGRTIRVPSNYNPVTRNYNGVWDGTWKIEYSNNPAFVGYDLIRNDRYGMNAYYDVTMDEMDIYEFGKWCDVQAMDGKPRFTFNGLISDPLGGREAINYIFGIGGGRFFDDGNGKGVVKFDDQSAATMLFGPENVEDGIFIYSFTDILSRTNDITVSFTNPKLNWGTDRRRVFDQSHQDEHGRIPLNFEAVGCTSAGEAIRRARYKLATALTETTVVSFKTNRAGLYATPYDIILIADPDFNHGLSGRLVSVEDNNKVNLRDEIYLEPGYNYTFVYHYVVDDEFEIRKVDITNGTTGSIKQIPLQGVLPTDIPEFMHFSIERRDGSAAPKAFRIISIGEMDNDPDKIEIQAIEVNRNKWLYIDGVVDDIDDAVDGLDVLPEPPENLRAKAEWTKTGRAFLYTVHLDWDKSPTKNVVAYKVYYSQNNGPWIPHGGKTQARRIEIPNLKRGEYQFKVSAVTNYDKEGDPIFIEHRLVGRLSEFNTPDSLRLIDAVSDKVYNTRSPVFGWGPVETGRHDKFVIQIVDADNYETVFATYKQDPRRFRYNYDDNKTDHGGTPARRYGLLVYSQDDDGDWGDPADIVVNNPAPPVPDNIVIEDTKAGAFVTFDEPTKADYKGVIIYASKTNNFTPGPSNEKYRGRSNNVRLKLDKDSTWRIRIAAFDTFGTSDLNMSPQFTLNTDGSVEVNDDPPVDFATDPTVQIVTRVQKSGEVIQKMRVNIDLTGRPNNESYIVRVIDTTEDPPEATRYPADEFPISFPVLANHTYEVRVRAKTRYGTPGNISGLANGGSITVPKKSTLPSLVANLTANRRLGIMRVKWDKNTDPDYKETVLLRNTVNNANTAEEVWSGPGNRYNDPDVVKGTQYYYWAYDYDTSDNASASRTALDAPVTYTGIGTSDTDTTTLAAPTSISISQSNRDINKDGSVDIALMTTFGFGPAGAAGYEVEWVDDLGQIASTRADTGKWWFPANNSRQYRARWRAVDWTNAPGLWSSYSGWITPTGITGQPVNASGVGIQAVPGGFLISWSAVNALDYSHTEISFNGGSTVHDIGIGTSKMCFWPTGSNTQPYVRHVNTSGLKSVSWVGGGVAIPVYPADIKQLFLGSDNSGTLGVLPYAQYSVTLTWKCDNSASGVSINIGGTTYNSLQFAAGQPMSISWMGNSPGSIVSISKSGGVWSKANAVFTLIR